MLQALAVVAGVSVGSFLNVVADRLPVGQSLIRPRSACGACKVALTFVDLVPVLSYLWLRGKCRHCGAPIPARLLVVEVTTGLLFVLVSLRFGASPAFIVTSCAVSLLLVLALIDIEHGVILNRLLLPAVVVILLLAPFWSELGLTRSFLGSHTMVASLLNSLVSGAGAFLFFLLILLVYPQGMGAGDVKMAGLLGLLVGFPGVAVALWIAIVSGGLVAVLLLLSRRKKRKEPIPFAPFLALGSVVALLVGSNIASWYGSLVTRGEGLWQ